MFLEVCQLKAVHPWLFVEVQQHLWREREGGRWRARGDSGREREEGRSEKIGRKEGREQQSGEDGQKVGSPDVM